MITFYTPLHELHSPQYEFFHGEKVPCFETSMRASGVLQEVSIRGHQVFGPTEDSREILMQVHSPRYLAFLESAWDQWIALDPANAASQPFPSVWPIRTLRDELEPDNFIARLGLYSMDNGTPMVAGTWTAVKAAADCAVSAAKHLSTGGESAFCATRPPGHHAGADFMGGYCFLNNAAVAAQALRNYGSSRVAILDVDYHHGNGTQSIFYDRADVLYISIHANPRIEYPFYLGYADEIGTNAGQGYNLNLPLPAGSSSQTWFNALDTACFKIDHAHTDALVVSLGLDPFAGDPLTKFNLSSDDFLKLGQRIKKVGLPTIFILEGGYATDQLGINAANVLDGFKGE